MANDTNETGTLIGSDKVEGTAVYGADSNKIGSIERVMIDKASGKVSYAVLGFGGFLGLGNDHYPLPWQSLKYDTRLGGYVTGVTERQLRGAPKYGNDNEWNWAMIITACRSFDHAAGFACSCNREFRVFGSKDGPGAAAPGPFFFRGWTLPLAANAP